MHSQASGNPAGCRFRRSLKKLSCEPADDRIANPVTSSRLPHGGGEVANLTRGGNGKHITCSSPLRQRIHLGADDLFGLSVSNSDVDFLRASFSGSRSLSYSGTLFPLAVSVHSS